MYGISVDAVTHLADNTTPLNRILVLLAIVIAIYILYEMIAVVLDKLRLKKLKECKKSLRGYNLNTHTTTAKKKRHKKHSNDVESLFSDEELEILRSAERL